MVTATQLSLYLYCPRKLFLSKVLLIEEPLKSELVKGNIWHETYEFINNNEKNIVSSINTQNYQDIYDLYRKNYSKFLRDAIIKNKTQLREFNIDLIAIFKDYWESFEEEAKERALNVSKFIEKNNIFGDKLWELLTPKLLSEQYFKSEKLNLSGIIDIIEIYDLDNKKSFVPVELKTGKYPNIGMWEGHKIQLAAYLLLLEDAGKEAPEAVIKYRGTQRRMLYMDPFLRSQVLDLITKTNTLLTSFELPEIIDNKNKCLSCSFKEKCYDEKIVNSLILEAKSRLRNIV